MSESFDDIDGLVFIDHAVAKDGRRDDLVAWFREAFELMASREPGLLAGTIAVSTSDPNLVVTYTHYASEEAHDAHQADVQSIPAYADLRVRLDDLLAEPLVMERCLTIAGMQRA